MLQLIIHNCFRKGLGGPFFVLPDKNVIIEIKERIMETYYEVEQEFRGNVCGVEINSQETFRVLAELIEETDLGRLLRGADENDGKLFIKELVKGIESSGYNEMIGKYEMAQGLAYDIEMGQALGQSNNVAGRFKSADRLFHKFDEEVEVTEKDMQDFLMKDSFVR